MVDWFGYIYKNTPKCIVIEGVNSSHDAIMIDTVNIGAIKCSVFSCCITEVRGSRKSKSGGDYWDVDDYTPLTQENRDAVADVLFGIETTHYLKRCGDSNWVVTEYKKG